MKKDIYYPAVFFALALALISFISYAFISNGKKEPEHVKVSFIIRGQQNSYWEYVKLGVDKAAYDMKADVSFITLLNDNDEKEQLEAIRREIENKTQIIVMSPTSENIFEKAYELNDKIKFIELESCTKYDNIYASIYADNFNMGIDIGRETYKKYKTGDKIVLIEPKDIPPYYRERINGVESILKSNNIEVEKWVLPLDQSCVDMLKANLMLDSANIIIALDYFTLYNTAYAIKSLNSELDIALFGINSTNEIISYLEEGVINTIVTENTFNLGYLGIKKAVETVKGVNFEPIVNIDYSTINIDNLYEKSNQRVLFPFVK